MLGPYQGHLLTPGMLEPVYNVEHDIASLIYGPLHLCVFQPYCVIDGASRDAGNVGHEEVLRPGLAMAKSSTTNKWQPWVTGGGEFGVCEGFLAYMGINTQYANADADRFLATIIVKGNLQARGCVIAASADYGLATTGDGLTIRQQTLYNFTFDDDLMARLSRPLPI